MPAITASQVPFGPGKIETLEQLIVWAIGCYEDMGLQRTYIELPNTPELEANVLVYKVTGISPFEYRAIGRVGLKVSQNWQANGMLYRSVQSQLTGTIPPAWVNG